MRLEGGSTWREECVCGGTGAEALRVLMLRWQHGVEEPCEEYGLQGWLCAQPENTDVLCFSGRDATIKYVRWHLSGKCGRAVWIDSGLTGRVVLVKCGVSLHCRVEKSTGGTEWCMHRGGEQGCVAGDAKSAVIALDVPLSGKEGTDDTEWYRLSAVLDQESLERVIGWTRLLEEQVCGAEANVARAQFLWSICWTVSKGGYRYNRGCRCCPLALCYGCSSMVERGVRVFTLAKVLWR